jgi:hypothetical protein
MGSRARRTNARRELLTISTILFVLMMLLASSAGANPRQMSGNEPAQVVSNGLPSECAQMIPDQITSVAGGATTYDYTLDGGSLQQVIPPAGFDLSTATNSQLSQYGYPPPPSGTPTREAWVSNFAGRGKFLTNIYKCPGTIFDFNTSSNWVGMYRANSSFTPYTAVIADFDQSGFNSCTSPKREDSGEGSFAAIGGQNGASLLQAGTGIFNPTTTQAYPFAEFVGKDFTDPGAVLSTNNVVTPGDEIETWVQWYDSTTPGWIEFYFYVADVTSGQWQFSATESLPGNHYQPDYRSDAEVMDERPNYPKSSAYPDSGLSPLRPFFSGGIYWPSTQMFGGNNYEQDTGNWTSMLMNWINNNNSRLANTASNGISVTDYWNACGIWDSP